MAVSKDFMEAVGQNKATRVRIMMKDSMLLDSSCQSFDEMLDYAKERIPDILVAHDGEIFKSQGEWDEDYLNEQMVSVINNFSAERLELLKKMVRELYGVKKAQTIETAVSHKYSENVHAESAQASGGTKLIGGCIAGAGAVALIAGLAVTDAPVIVSIAGGAAIGVGAYLLLKK